MLSIALMPDEVFLLPVSLGPCAVALAWLLLRPWNDRKWLVATLGPLAFLSMTVSVLVCSWSAISAFRELAASGQGGAVLVRLSELLGNALSRGAVATSITLMVIVGFSVAQRVRPTWGNTFLAVFQVLVVVATFAVWVMASRTLDLLNLVTNPARYNEAVAQVGSESMSVVAAGIAAKLVMMLVFAGLLSVLCVVASAAAVFSRRRDAVRGPTSA